MAEETDRSARLDGERLRAQARIEDLREELAAIAHSTAAGPDDEHDAEGSTIGYERARIQALLAHAHRVAAALDEAASRPPARFCQRCGAQIPAERVDALPATRTCVTCAASPG